MLNLYRDSSFLPVSTYTYLYLIHSQDFLDFVATTFFIVYNYVLLIPFFFLLTILQTKNIFFRSIKELHKFVVTKALKTKPQQMG